MPLMFLLPLLRGGGWEGWKLEWSKSLSFLPHLQNLGGCDGTDQTSGPGCCTYPTALFCLRSGSLQGCFYLVSLDFEHPQVKCIGPSSSESLPVPIIWSSYLSFVFCLIPKNILNYKPRHKVYPSGFLKSSFGGPSPTACGILVPWLGIKPAPPASEVWSLNLWTAGKALSQ